MKNEVIKAVAKQCWYYITAYITHYLVPIIKENALKTKDYFIDLLWNSLKTEFANRAKSATEYIEKFFNSPDYNQKEKEVIDILFRNVNLPLFLKPFRPILKRILHKKVQKLVSKYLKKINVKF